ncbi:hypothetical protein MCEMRE196_00055 [Candidatus Nanopelagicaceae bacterium]
MKRAWLIAGGTVGGLGAVMAITPPQLSSNTAGSGLELIPAPAQTTAAADNPTPAATKSGATTKPVATKSAKPATTKSATAAATATATTAATTAATQAASNKAQSGTFTGDPYTMRYGTVQVKITINNGIITDAVAVTAPRGENQRYTDRAVPVMRQKTLAAQSSNITSVSGASYTAYAWYISLQSALSKAGWM